MIKAVIFDWAGVLADDGYWVWLRKSVPDIEPRKSEFQSLSEKVDGGVISHNAFMQYLSEASGKTPELIWQEVKNEIKINHKLIDSISVLKNDYQVALLSNFTYTWLNDIISESNLWELFDKHIVSSEHKMIKPNHDIYEKMLLMLEINAEEAVFVDDRQRNVDASVELGIKGLLYTNFETFKKDLQNLGVEI